MNASKSRMDILYLQDLLNLIENACDRKRIYASPSSYPNSNPNPKAQLCFRTDEMTSFFDQVYRYRICSMIGRLVCCSIIGFGNYTVKTFGLVVFIP